MKKQQQQLRKIIDDLKSKNKKLEQKIDKRNEIYGNRSENWQLSEKGAEYEVDTEFLQCDFDSVEDVILSLENAFEELSSIIEN